MEQNDGTWSIRGTDGQRHDIDDVDHQRIGLTDRDAAGASCVDEQGC
ncbi:MAG: hypothetical protein PHE53_02695 [Thermoguttaceae bacterium]|nr:hypothetical protein [Thermoguttaceae bacterium]